jgi:hypothetical protein
MPKTSLSAGLAAIASGLVLGAASTAAAADEAVVLRDFFSGTLEIDVPAGDWSAKRYLAPDHTYRETGTDGAVTGTWKLEGERVCITPDKPVGGDDRTNRYCNLGPGKHAGDTWRDADPVTGNAVFFKLSPGRS